MHSFNEFDLPESHNLPIQSFDGWYFLGPNWLMRHWFVGSTPYRGAGGRFTCSLPLGDLGEIARMSR